MEIREAKSGEVPEIASILDAAYLQIESDSFGNSINSGTVLVSVATRNSETDAEATGPILGALVLDGEEVAAIAVRPGRRGQGIGSALVEAAKERRGRLVAEFDERVRPFWDALGFNVTHRSGSERLRGVTRK